MKSLATKLKKRSFYPPLSLTLQQREEVVVKLAAHVVVEPNGCWILPFSRNHGYSNLSIFGASFRGHRYSYAAHVGDIPEGQLVMHSCDNRACVNPAHLLLGTQTKNLEDALTKGRLFHQTHPEEKKMMGRVYAARRVYTCKPKPARQLHFHALSDEQVEALRTERASIPRPKLRVLALKYGISESNVSMICAGKSRTKPLTLAGS